MLLSREIVTFLKLEKKKDIEKNLSFHSFANQVKLNIYRVGYDTIQGVSRVHLRKD